MSILGVLGMLHAAWLMTRFRVNAGRTSYEMMFGRDYRGKVILFGE